MAKSFILFDSDSLKDFHKRIFFSMLLFLFVYFVAIYRITQIMIIAPVYKIVQVNETFEERGKIFDRNGNLLATTINSNSLSTNPIKIKNKTELAKKLSSILNINEFSILNNLLKEDKFVWIKRHITPTEHQQIIDLGEINLRIEEEKKRIYPYSNLASHVVGYVDIDGIGGAGIERAFNDQLSKSENIYLTLDINLQQAVREELSETVKKFKAESGLAVILDIKKSQIISSVSFPDFNPNDRKTFNEKNLINRVIQSNFEMGSTFKPITVAMGYDKNLISPDMTFDVTKKIKGISDYSKYEGDGIYNVEKIIVKSSNIGAAKIASLIGKQNQKEFFKKIGFFDKLNIEILEAAEPLGNKHNWGKVETMTIGYGYGFAITPLHLVKAYASIANDGFEVRPTIVFGKQKDQKNQLLLKEDTSDYFLKLLRSVVTKTTFTGPRVKVEGYDIGGKTGTAMLTNEKGGYYKDRDLTSFISLFPIEDPEYLVLTIIEYPKIIKGLNKKTTGAWINAPLVKDIILRMIGILKIPKKISEELLNADIKHIYKPKNVTF